jgi:hypothetical protein
MPEITTITSESLQAEVRRLLPSQRGFGTDLEAQNVIVPIVDLTATAEGSVLRSDLQTAASYGNITSVNRSTAGTTTLINTTGFYKFQLQTNLPSSSSTGSRVCLLQMLRPSSPDINLLRIENVSGSAGLNDFEYNDGIVFLSAGDSLAVTIVGTGYVAAQAWPIADVNGNFINPDGFTFE